jgi:hypothetical protein
VQFRNWSELAGIPYISVRFRSWIEFTEFRVIPGIDGSRSVAEPGGARGGSAPSTNLWAPSSRFLKNIVFQWNIKLNTFCFFYLLTELMSWGKNHHKNQLTLYWIQGSRSGGLGGSNPQIWKKSLTFCQNFKKFLRNLLKFREKLRQKSGFKLSSLFFLTESQIKTLSVKKISQSL